MRLLKERILKEGGVLNGDIIRVDGFLNHRVDIGLIREIAREFKRRFNTESLTAVVTVEASGIALAAICAEEFGVPMIFAKKAKSDNIEGGLYSSEIFSYTYQKRVTLLMSSRWLGAQDNVLIVDDFLANGEALRGLVDIVAQSGARLEGIGIVVEKGFQPGGARLRAAGYNLKSLAIIDSVSNGNIIFRQDSDN